MDKSDKLVSNGISHAASNAVSEKKRSAQDSDSEDRSGRETSSYDYQESEDESEAEFTVEKIVDMRVRNGKKEYLLKWRGFPDAQNTWEPQCNLSCTELLTEFKSRLSCACKGDCSNRRCACVKAGGKCGDTCRCAEIQCKNRAAQEKQRKRRSRKSLRRLSARSLQRMRPS